jgi:sigma-B regulation protein RsbQ
MLSASLNFRRLPASSPRGRTLVFGHGYGCDQSMWKAVVDAMPGHHRILFDWPGAGTTLTSTYDTARHHSLEGYADDLLQVLEEQDLGPVVYVGHSVAATVGVLAALRAPQRFALLGLVAPSPCFSNDPPGYAGGFEADALVKLVQGLTEDQHGWARAVAPLVVGPAAADAPKQWIERSFCAMDPEIAVRWARATFLSDWRGAFRRVTTPSLILQCQDDVLAPLSVGEWMLRQMPQGRLQVLPVSGHCPHVVAPQLVVQALETALAGTADAPK